MQHGADAFRAAGLIPALAELGHQVEDRGNLVPSSGEGAHHANPVLKFLPEFVGWTHAIRDAVIARARRWNSCRRRRRP